MVERYTGMTARVGREPATWVAGILCCLACCAAAAEAEARPGEVADGGAVDPAQAQYRFERLWPVLPQPWLYDNPTHAAVDSAGNVYLVDGEANRVHKLDSEGHFITAWGTYGGNEGQFDHPAGIAVDAEDCVYVADSGNNRIQKFTSDGHFLRAWGSAGFGPGELNNPQGIVADSGTGVYVVDTGNRRVQRFTVDGDFVTQWGSFGVSDGQFILASGIAAAPDGSVYVVDKGLERIQRFSSAGAYLSQWDGSAGPAGPFASPWDITADGQGNLYVTDTGNDRIQCFSADGTFLRAWGQYGAGLGSFWEPVGVAAGDGGRVYVVDRLGANIQKFTADGVCLARWGSKGAQEGFMNLPGGVALGPGGDLFVTDRLNYRVQRFSATGQYVLQWGTQGAGNTQFERPFGVAADADGNVYAVDYDGDCVRKFDASGSFITRWGTTGTGNGQFLNPCGAAADSQGNVYVADMMNGRVQKFDSDGAYVGQWGQEPGLPVKLDRPHGIAITPNGRVYVLDTGNNLVQEFTTTGDAVRRWGGVGIADGNFDTPMGIAVDMQGNVYVADTNNHRVQVFSPDGTFLASCGREGSNPGEMLHPAGIAVDGGGKVYAADQFNNRIQVFEPVAITENSRAVVLAGGGPFPGNSLWDATQMCANYAHRVLGYQGFTKESIYYLSADVDLDLDGNGIADDVDADATKANLQYALTQWAPAEVNGLPVGDVVLYMVDHGGPDTFRISGTEVLTAGELDAWLDALQPRIQGKLTVVVDACYCGSLVDNLSAPDRIVVTSASADEEAQFQGSVSCSDYFWTRVFAGDTVHEAFETAVEGAASQTPLLDDNGNGTGNDGSDGALAAVTHIGAGNENAFTAPVITAAVPDHTVAGTATTDLWLEAVDADGVGQAWAIIQPPDAASATSYPARDLAPAGGARWEATVDAFSSEGTYQVLLYARDRSGSTSPPAQVSVTVGNPLRRKALIVAGAASTASTRWPGIEHAADQAYRALREQSYGDADIYYLSASGTAGVNGAPTRDNVNWAIETWAASETHDLVVYFVGDGAPETVVLNGAESIGAGELDAWLDSLQAALPGAVVVLLDTDYAGTFLPALVPPQGTLRLVMTSTDANSVMGMSCDGAVSFSAYFWSQVLNGAKAGAAYSHAALAMFYAAGASCLLDDTGDGQYIIKGDNPDGVFANQYRIGSGLLLAGDEPIIGDVVDEQVLTGTEEALLWVSGVTSTAGIDRLTATVRPPGAETLPGALLPTFELESAGDGRYERLCTGFSVWGEYYVAVAAFDRNGAASLPAVTRVVRADGPDAYEDDDARERASWLGLDAPQPQRHNFHDAGDEDWARFHAEAGDEVTIETANLGPQADTYLELCRANGAVVAANDDRPLALSSYLRWTVDADGFYYARVTDAAGGHGPDTGYDLKAWRAVGPDMAGPIILSVLSTAGGAVGGASVTVMGLNPYHPPVLAWSQATGLCTVGGLPVGAYQLQVSAAGYVPSGPVSVSLSAGPGVSRMVMLTPTSTTGSVTVAIEPAEARAAGARWRLDGGDWKGSGATAANLGEGPHTVTFKPLPGWAAPAAAVATITPQQTVNLTGTYSQGNSRVPPPAMPERKSALEWLAVSVAEEVLPLDVEGGQGATVAPDAALALRLTAEDAIVPETVWAVADADGWVCERATWRVTALDDGRDGWAVLTPDTPMPIGSEVTVTASAETVAGNAVGPVTYRFRVAEDGFGSPGKGRLEIASPGESLPAVMARAVGSVYGIVPEGVYEEAAAVMLPVPDGVDPAKLGVYYWSGSARHRGWYEPEHVRGWLDGAPELVEEGGQRYLMFLVNHSGVVQLGQRVEASRGGLAPVVLTGGSRRWLMFLSVFTLLVILLARSALAPVKDCR